ncbi:hypothetical protein RHECIAT_CH0002873 [Rhizobium etli CIAT 652]|uniref:Uncharacterized protein n=1 Tax=Rhizobium etli (strain CIAT 652) TaxID=491916 RepID=B3PT78_RHIE6|nr:hypothetical protein RHECIAT_CH0002873 [Rhizobium etli CIAT 652]
MSTILTYFLVTVTCGKSYAPRFWMFGISLDADAHPISKPLGPEFAARRQPHQRIIPLIKTETG